jgi:Uma2 family endonuclease
MSSATKTPSLLAPARPIPSLKELRELTAEPDQRVVIRDVDWAFYEQLVNSIPEDTQIRVDFDGRDIELMTLGLFHDGSKKLLGQLVEAVAQELSIPYKSAGQTTWIRPEVARGLESDESYFFRAEKLAAVAAARARKSRDLADYPNPDLGIEVDDSPSKIDRPGIYAALRVAEVWRFDVDLVFIDRLAEDGSYQPAERSLFLLLTAEEIRRWVVEEDTSDESAWARRLRAWARAELAPRRPR